MIKTREWTTGLDPDEGDYFFSGFYFQNTYLCCFSNRQIFQFEPEVSSYKVDPLITLETTILAFCTLDTQHFIGGGPGGYLHILSLTKPYIVAKW